MVVGTVEGEAVLLRNLLDAVIDPLVALDCYIGRHDEEQLNLPLPAVIHDLLQIIRGLHREAAACFLCEDRTRLGAHLEIGREALEASKVPLPREGIQPVLPRKLVIAAVIVDERRIEFLQAVRLAGRQQHLQAVQRGPHAVEALMQPLVLVVVLEPRRAVEIENHDLRVLVTAEFLQVMVGDPERLLGRAVIIGGNSLLFPQKTCVDVAVNMTRAHENDVDRVARLRVQASRLVDAVAGLKAQHLVQKHKRSQGQQDEQQLKAAPV